MVWEDLSEILLGPTGRAGAIIDIASDVPCYLLTFFHAELRSQKLGPTGSVNACFATR